MVWKFTGVDTLYHSLLQSLSIPGRSHSGVHILGCSCTQCRASVTLHCTPAHYKNHNVIILITHIAQNITIWALQDDSLQYKEHFKMIRYSINQIMKILWFYAETKSIKLSQHKFKEHFKVARAPPKANYPELSWQMDLKCLAACMILAFSKEWNWKCLGKFKFFLSCVCVFHIAVVHHLKISILVKQKGI